MLQQIIIGILLAICISLLAYRANTLTRSGAWAAAITGSLVFGLGGLPAAALLLTFFISSSALSRAFARRKAGLMEKFSKGSRRDWGQVIANGGLGALLAVAYVLHPDLAWPWVAFAGAMAAVNADTWATELGVLSPSLPRLITTGKPVERGASGGISLYGSLAALAGASLVAVVAVLFTPQATHQATHSPISPLLLLSVTIAGMLGSFFDSFLGATVQAIYYCPTCQKETERHPTHTCGTPTVKLRGCRWLDNDLVNFSCSLIGALAACLFYLLF